MTVLRIFGQRKWLIVRCVVLFTVITFVVTLAGCEVAPGHTAAQRVHAPRYTAVAYLGVNPLQRSAFDTDQGQFAEAHAIGLKAAHAQMIKRETILLRALDSHEVKNTAWYQRDREGALERLGEILTVTPAPKANLISISITEVAPQEQDRIDLAEIANAVAIAYVQDVRVAARDTRAGQIKRLRDKLAELHEMSDTIQSEIKRRKLPEIQILQERMKAQGAKLEVLAGESVQLGLIKTQIEGVLKDLEEHAKAGTLPKMAEIRAMVDSAPIIRALREREQDLHSKRVSLLEEVGEKDNSVVAIDASLAAVHKQIAPAIKEAAPVQAEALKEQLLAKLESVTRQLLSVKEQKARIHDTVLVDLQRNLIAMRELQAREKGIAENVRRINNTLLQLELLAEADRPVWLRAKATRPRTITSPK